MSDDPIARNQTQDLAESIVDAVRQPLVLLSEDFRVRCANRAFYEMFEVDRAEAEGRLIYEFGSRQWDIPRLRQLLPEILPQRRTVEGLEIRHTLDGTGERIMLLSARPLPRAADRPPLILVEIEDVTEHRRTETALRASDERLREILEIDTVGLLLFDRQGTLVDANEAFLHMTGYSRRQVEARELTWHTMTPPEWIEASEDQLAQLEATGRIGPYEKEYFRRDGSRSWMLFAGRRLGDGGIAEYCVDVVDRKRAEQALRESEERYRTLFNSIDQGFCIIEMIFDDDGRPVDYRFLDVNASFERQTGLVDAVGRTMRSLAPHHEEHWFETYGRVALTGEPERFEKPAAELGHYYEVYAFRLGDPEERRVGVLFQDIAPRKRAEAERELLVRELSHRVKNILAVVQALARQTDARSGSIEDFRESFLGRLQALARAHSLLLDAQWRGTDLGVLVDQAISAYRAGDHDVVEVEGDPVAVTTRQGLGLSLVLHELGTNAAKYGALSRHAGRLRIAWTVEDGHRRRVRLRWQERGGPPARPAAGKGFGMQLIERACAYELDGEVALDCAPEGLTCEVTFPLEEA